MTDIRTASEQELRESKVPTPATSSELVLYIESLLERSHDYGTCVYAVSMSATAAFNYAAHVLGITGFQASVADLDILARTRRLKRGKILDYEKLLYPQYMNQEAFPSLAKILRDNIEWLSREAREKLRTAMFAAPGVVKHWEWLASEMEGLRYA